MGGSYFVLKDRSSRDVSGSLRIPRRFADIPGQQSFVLIKQESDGRTVKGRSRSYDSTRAVRQDFGNVRGMVGSQIKGNLFVVIRKRSYDRDNTPLSFDYTFPSELCFTHPPESSLPLRGSASGPGELPNDEVTARGLVSRPRLRRAKST